MKTVIVILSVIFVSLQYKLWFGAGNMTELWELHTAIVAQTSENAVLRERNDALYAEVKDLKYGLEAIEERARIELGLVMKGETFYQIIDGPVASLSDR